LYLFQSPRWLRKAFRSIRGIERAGDATALARLPARAHHRRRDGGRARLFEALQSS
jgi:hypothetical protein